MYVCFCLLFEVEFDVYLYVEMLYDVVGSVKFEGFGIVLFDVIDLDDFIVFVGLLLIVFMWMLCVVGYLLFVIICGDCV